MLHEIRSDLHRLLEPAPVETPAPHAAGPDPHAVAAVIGDCAGYVHTALVAATDAALAEVVAAPEFGDRLYATLVAAVPPAVAAERWGGAVQLEQAATTLEGDAKYAAEHGNVRSALINGAAARLLREAVTVAAKPQTKESRP